MQAITLAKTGGVDVIEKTEQPIPAPRPGDALIKVSLHSTPACVNILTPGRRIFVL